MRFFRRPIVVVGLTLCIALASFALYIHADIRTRELAQADAEEAFRRESERLRKEVRPINQPVPLAQADAEQGFRSESERLRTEAQPINQPAPLARAAEPYTYRPTVEQYRPTVELYEQKTAEQRRVEARIQNSALIENRRPTSSEAEMLRRAAESIVANDRRNRR